MLRATLWLAALAFFGSAKAQTIVHGEYFIDQDNGFGSPQNGQLVINATTNVTDTTYTIDLAGLAPGVHTIGVRTKDAAGHWGLTNFTPVLITEPPPPIDDLVEVEYFLNQDPGLGAGTTAWVGSDTDTASLTFTADLTDATAGVNTLFVRSRTADGVWGHTNHTAVLVTPTPPALPVIDRVEAFNLTDGPDPGFGNATPFTVSDPQSNLVVVTLTSDLPMILLTMDTLAIRSHDADGKWSQTNFVSVLETSVVVLNTAVGISVYPNPFTEGITVKTNDGMPVRVVLYDPQGKLVHDKLLTGETHIDLQTLASGTYTAFFWKDLERIHRVQLVKQ